MRRTAAATDCCGCAPEATRHGAMAHAAESALHVNFSPLHVNFSPLHESALHVNFSPLHVATARRVTPLLTSWAVVNWRQQEKANERRRSREE
jgi:hypothetical protein